jgi:glycosyltransferase involved in cell wall biosynthesis
VTTPDIDVVIPVRNGGRLLRNAIDSVIEQDAGMVQVTVVDDGSTDRCCERLPRHPRMRVVANEGHGIPAALNTGIAVSTAPYIARQDADDESLPGRLSAQLRHLEANPGIGIVGTAFEVVIGTQTVSVLSPLPRRLLEKNPFCAGSVVGRREVFEAAGLHRHQFALSSDYDMWLRCASVSGISMLPQVGYRYRLSATMSSVRSASRQSAYADLARASARAKIRGEADPAEAAFLLAADGHADDEVNVWWAREFAAFGAWRDVLECLRRLPRSRALMVGGSLLWSRRSQAAWT